MPNGEIAFQLIEPQLIEPHPKAQEKIIEFEKTEKINTAFLKIIHKLPEGCLSISCIEKLTQSYPMLPFSCANCSNSEKLILKVGFYPHALPLCRDCTKTECAEKSPLHRMRQILFKKCVLFTER
jgi:hypothetical protein